MAISIVSQKELDRKAAVIGKVVGSAARLLHLKSIKTRIDAGTATKAQKKIYSANKSPAWKALDAAMADYMIDSIKGRKNKIHATRKPKKASKK